VTQQLDLSLPKRFAVKNDGRFFCAHATRLAARQQHRGERHLLNHCELRHSNWSIAQDAGTQSAAAAEKFFRAGSKGLIHPVTRPTFLHAGEGNALNVEFRVNQFVEVLISRDDIPPQKRRRFINYAELAAKRVVSFLRKKGHLPFIGVFVIEKAVAANSAPRYTFNRWHFKNWMSVRRFAMVTKEIVSGRNVEMRNFHMVKYHFPKSLRASYAIADAKGSRGSYVGGRSTQK